MLIKLLANSKPLSPYFKKPYMIILSTLSLKKRLKEGHAYQTILLTKSTVQTFENRRLCKVMLDFDLDSAGI